MEVNLGVNFKDENQTAHAPLSSLRAPLDSLAAGNPHVSEVQVGVLGHAAYHTSRAPARTEGVMKTITSTQSGVAGEYFVAAELSRRGFVASLTLRNTRGIDVLASNADATKSVGIQVKTAQVALREDRRYSNAHWMLNVKAETAVGKNHFYVFVVLPDQGEPSYYVVPSANVAEFVSADHKQWKDTPGRKGQQRSLTNPMRIFKDPDGKYKDRWDLLGLMEVNV